METSEPAPPEQKAKLGMLLQQLLESLLASR